MRLILVNENGLQILLSFAQFSKKYSFWSKDLIFLVTDQKYVGTLAWLQAYHGLSPSLKGIDISLIFKGLSMIP